MRHTHITQVCTRDTSRRDTHLDAVDSVGGLERDAPGDARSLIHIEPPHLLRRHKRTTTSPGARKTARTARNGTKRGAP